MYLWERVHVRADHPVSVGIVRWGHLPARTTVVVKVAFGMARGGASAILPEPIPVTLDRLGPSNELAAPSDFVPFKSLCDVALVGLPLLAGRVRLQVRSDDSFTMTKEAPDAVQLRARPTLGPQSDPTDPIAADIWGSPAFDFEQFQCAPDDQRIPFPSNAIAFSLETGGATFAMSIPIGMRVVCVTRDADVPIDVQADTLLIDPQTRGCCIAYRGILEAAPFTESATLVVSGRSAAVPNLVRAPGSFRAGTVLEPHMLRRPLASERAALRGMSKTIRLMTPPGIGITTDHTSAAPLRTQPMPRSSLAGITQPRPLPPQETMVIEDDDIILLESTSGDRTPIGHDLDEVTQAEADTRRVVERMDLRRVQEQRKTGKGMFDPETPLMANNTMELPSFSPEAIAALPFSRRVDLEPSPLQRLDTATISTDGLDSNFALPFIQGAPTAPPQPLPYRVSDSTPPPPPGEVAPGGQPAARQILTSAAHIMDEPPPPAPLPPAPAQVGRSAIIEQKQLPAVLPTAPSSVGAASNAAAGNADSPSAPARTLAPASPPEAKKLPVPKTTKGASLTLEQVIQIKRELFESPDQRREILASHGLTGLEWRLALRAFARDFDEKAVNPDQLRKLIDRS